MAKKKKKSYGKPGSAKAREERRLKDYEKYLAKYEAAAMATGPGSESKLTFEQYKKRGLTERKAREATKTAIGKDFFDEITRASLASAFNYDSYGQWRGHIVKSDLQADLIQQRVYEVTGQYWDVDAIESGRYNNQLKDIVEQWGEGQNFVTEAALWSAFFGS